MYKDFHMNRILLSTTKNLAEINPKEGAILTRLVLNNQEVLKYPLKEDEPRKGFPSAILFPFPNRIKDGKYELNGKTYHLKTNDLQSMNAIHGLVAFEEFEITEKSDEAVELRYTYTGDNTGYPFPYILKIKYTLTEQGLELMATAINNGKEILPYGFGWHPYFSFDHKKVSNYSIKAPPRERFLLNDRYIPTGDLEDVDDAEISLQNVMLDDVHRIKDEVQEAETALSFQNKKLIISHKASCEALKYLVIYIPPSRDCVAIEPQTCCTNSFNTGEGLLFLKPGEKSTFKIGVRLEE